jgi:hypothetical protein
MNVFVLSYDSYVYRENEKLFVYRWIKVGRNQVGANATAFFTLPEEKSGEVVRYNIDGSGEVLLKVMGDGRLRRLTPDEKESDIVKLRVPRI